MLIFCADNATIEEKKINYFEQKIYGWKELVSNDCVFEYVIYIYIYVAIFIIMLQIFTILSIILMCTTETGKEIILDDWLDDILNPDKKKTKLDETAEQQDKTNCVKIEEPKIILLFDIVLLILFFSVFYFLVLPNCKDFQKICDLKKNKIGFFNFKSIYLGVKQRLFNLSLLQRVFWLIFYLSLFFLFIQPEHISKIFKYIDPLESCSEGLEFLDLYNIKSLFFTFIYYLIMPRY